MSKKKKDKNKKKEKNTVTAEPDTKSRNADKPQAQPRQQPQPATGQQQQATQSPPGLLPVQILAQYIKDFSFENPNSPASIITDMGQPQTNVRLNVQVRETGNEVYEVILLTRIESRYQKTDKAAFIIELAYACLASMPQVPKQHHDAVLKIEVPRLIFPFAREVIGNATMRGGYPPLWLQPVNFEGLYMREKEAQAAARQNQ